MRVALKILKLYKFDVYMYSACMHMYMYMYVVVRLRRRVCTVRQLAVDSG